MPSRIALCMAALILSLLAVTPVLACLWDYDTLRDEQRGLPTVAAILAGKWEKHSISFYEDRERRMRERLASAPDDLDAADNLAVALEKLGKVDLAIATLEPIVVANPERYEAHANLGTFHLHRFIEGRDRADLDRGIEHIERALAINPEAHFGREEYQLQLAKYVQASLDDPAVLDRGSFVMPMLMDESQEILDGFDDPIKAADYQEGNRRRVRIGISKAKPIQIEKAIEGMVGMIRFGTGTSPHLYYALGDLLAAKEDKHLAAWAYLRAIEFDHPRPEQVREAISQTIESISPETTATEIEADFAKAKAEGDSWVAAYQKYEDDLVSRGVDVNDEADYAAFYDEHGDNALAMAFDLRDYLARKDAMATIAILGLLALASALVVIYFVRRRTHRRA